MSNAISAIRSMVLTIIILHAFFVRIDAKELVLNHAADANDFSDALVNKLVDKLVDKLVAIPQASRLATHGRILPSAFTSPLKVRTALAPHNPNAVIPNAVMDKVGSKQSLSYDDQAREAKEGFADWPAKYRSLLKRGLKPVTPEEALKMTKAPLFPAKLIDVRLASVFDAGHAEGSTSLPLFRIVQGNSLYDQSKRITAYSLGIQPTERNPEFQAEALKQLNFNQPIIIACDRGGTLENLVDEKKAREATYYTASLRAASDLYDAGFKKLFFLKGGLNDWDSQGFPTEGEGADPMSALFGGSRISPVDFQLWIFLAILGAAIGKLLA